MERLLRVVYEDGVFKPLERVRLSEHEVCLVSVYPEERWRKDFEALLKRVQRRTRNSPAAEIEADITAARAEIKAKRRASRRSA